MKSFKEYLELLEEKLITFGGKPYPKFGNVVILAGGAGSGKGFILSNLLGIEGNVLDVDALKKLAMKSDKLNRRVKEEFDVDLKNLSLKDSDNTAKLHVILSNELGITDAHQKKVLSAAYAADPERKPNLIFDTTLSNSAKVKSITDSLKRVGYDDKNIHVVWVLNHFDMAVKQNAGRDRVVPDEVMLSTHEGAALTMKKVVSMGADIKKYLNGDIWIAFNQKGQDSTVVIRSDDDEEKVGVEKQSKLKDIKSPLATKQKSKGFYVKDALYIQLKKQGKSPESDKKLTDILIKKIRSYVPKTELW